MAITGKDHPAGAPDVRPARTPGPLGINDAGDPTVTSFVGHTPGPLGFNDGGGYFSEAARDKVRHGVYGSPTNYIIPSPRSATPPLISDQDFADSASALGVEAAAIYAVCKVESGGRSGFDSKGRPKILFEAKWFHKFSGGRYDGSHPHLSQFSWEGARRYYRDDQWVRLLEASRLQVEAALKSASWGKFQIMGSTTTDTVTFFGSATPCSFLNGSTFFLSWPIAKIITLSTALSRRIGRSSQKSTMVTDIKPTSMTRN